MQRKRGQSDVPQNMVFHDGTRALAPDASEAHVLALHDVNHFLARVKRDVRNTHQRKGDGRKRQMRQRVGEGNLARNTHGNRQTQREPTKLNRENGQQDKTDPKRRRCSQNIAVHANELVDGAAAEHAGSDAKHEAQNAADHPGNRHQHERIARSIRNNLRHRRVEPERGAHVAVKQTSHPACIALEHRRICAPMLGEHSALRLTHVHIGSLTQIRLNRIDGRQADQREHHETDREHQQHEAQYVFENEINHRQKISLKPRPPT